ncbi:asparagine synthase, partial [Sulfurimonas sp. SAG-AH-194-I05]
SLKAGELIVIKENEIKRVIYNRYEPWKIIQKDYTLYIDELSAVTLSIFKKIINNLNGRQVIIPLSAGNDSRLVASCLKHLGYTNVLCYSYGTNGNFESEIARVIAKKVGYEFIFIPMTHKKEKKYYNSKEYQKFLTFADTCSSIQFIQSISTIRYLKENDLIDSDAVFINGNSGDFISGGHISGKVQNDNSVLSKEERLNIILDQIIKKHFTLWGYLKTDFNLLKIQDLLQKELKNENIVLDSINHDHGVYEYLEFINRQSKYVITGQRVYEFYGYEWRLPLWDDEYLNFWKKIPKEYKVNQKLYKDMLKLSNFGDVWSNDIPVNRYNIVPKWIVPIRMISKVPFTLFGLSGKKYWHQFEISFFQYWMDVIHMSNAVEYKRMIKVFFKKQRNVISLLVEDYINKLRNEI